MIACEGDPACGRPPNGRLCARVLLVEDNAMNRELVCDLLEREGHVVDALTDGASLRRYLLSDARPDIVLLDILLPDADGVELLRDVRASALAKLPVIAVTAHALAGTSTRLLAAGFDDVWTKPINTRTFAAAVEARASQGHLPKSEPWPAS